MIVVMMDMLCSFFFFNHKTAYALRISDWSSDVCSSDLRPRRGARDPCVEVAVDDIIIDAPRPAHRDRAEQHPEKQRPVAPRPAAERQPPGAGPIEQPPTDRPVEAREQRIAAHARGQQRDRKSTRLNSSH